MAIVSIRGIVSEVGISHTMLRRRVKRYYLALPLCSIRSNSFGWVVKAILQILARTFSLLFAGNFALDFIKQANAK
jgi:hypothetical protein